MIGSDSHAYGSTANLAGDLPPTLNTGINNQNLGITYSSAGNFSTAASGTYSINGAWTSGTGLASDYNVSFTPGVLTVMEPPPATVVMLSTPKVKSGHKTTQVIVLTFSEALNAADAQNLALIAWSFRPRRASRRASRWRWPARPTTRRRSRSR